MSYHIVRVFMLMAALVFSLSPASHAQRVPDSSVTGAARSTVGISIPGEILKAGLKCPSGQVPSGGQCVNLPAAQVSCPWGQAPSGSGCIDLQTVVANNTWCPSGYYRSGWECKALPSGANLEAMAEALGCPDQTTLKLTMGVYHRDSNSTYGEFGCWNGYYFVGLPVGRQAP